MIKCIDQRVSTYNISEYLLPDAKWAKLSENKLNFAVCTKLAKCPEISFKSVIFWKFHDSASVR